MSDAAITPEQTHRLLNDTERRQLVVILSDIDHCVPLTTLVERVSERMEVSNNETRELYESLRIHLHHNHLPLFADVGVVEYNADQRLVRPTTKLEAVTDHVDRTQKKIKC